MTHKSPSLFDWNSVGPAIGDSFQKLEPRLLAESERLSRTLLNSISHELRTPLAAITSATSTLADGGDASEALRRAMIGEIQEASTRLNRVVGNLLDVT